VNTFAQRKAERSAYYHRHVYGWKLRTCSACGGSGRYDARNSPKCSSCGGSGRERFKPTIDPLKPIEDGRPCYRMNAAAYAKWHASEGYSDGISNRARSESVRRAARYGYCRLGDVPELLLSLKDYCAMRVRPSGVSQFIACREYPLQVAVEDWVVLRRESRRERQMIKKG
jgi:hypothetical protein